VAHRSITSAKELQLEIHAAIWTENLSLAGTINGHIYSHTYFPQIITIAVHIGKVSNNIKARLAPWWD
jgi:hypothetical protein